MDLSSAKLAVLIDADNVSASVLEGLLAEIARIGEVTVKRVYGDFTSRNSKKWIDILNRFAIKPMQQFAYTTGKNATDGALIIDAMDLLHTGRFDGFCIVSSDSDYTGLAVRLKEEGLQVYGFGEKKTPEAFRNACHKFTFIEVLRNTTSATTPPPAITEVVPDLSKEKKVKVPPKESPIHEGIPFDLIKAAIENSCNESGIARLSAVGINLLRLKPDFDARLYGNRNSSLASLLRSNPDIFEMSGSGGTISVRIKA